MPRNRRPNRTYTKRPDTRKTRHDAIHEHNPAGSKFLRKVAKHLTGMRQTARYAAWIYKEQK